MEHNWQTTVPGWGGFGGSTKAWWTAEMTVRNAEKRIPMLYIGQYGTKYYIQQNDFSGRTTIGAAMDTLDEAKAIYLLMTE
jgi:hypothetical protein